MHHFETDKEIPYPIYLVKKIILDIEDYPLFLPWCEQATILSSNRDEIIAKLRINFKNFLEEYISKVKVTENDRHILIKSEAISGPFQKLTSIWTLKQTDQGTKLHFSIDFQLKSKILDIVVGMVFYTTTQEMVTAFEKRVQKLHM
ncbi:MAG: type II toxin-antitoxin system RatA family toxin [Rickettsiaceae bacterium]|nr:type II toxin-antitoxin system RatA family toxin [Rickettsiaceae bacterium]